MHTTHSADRLCFPTPVTMATSRFIVALCAFLTFSISVVDAQETFTNSECRAATSSMNACAKRWDSIRLACKDSISTNTIWPGPCECAYYANDLPCFDEQAFCAAQVWTQVPQWFRDGVSSCIMKDATYTVRANLGSASGVIGNPFTVTDLPGKLQATRTGVDAGLVTGQPAQTGASASIVSPTSVSNVDNREGLSTGAKAGFGVGIGVGVVLIAVAAFLIARSRKVPVVADAEKRVDSPAELHDVEKKIYQLESKSADPKSELSGSLSPRYEMGARTSTWLAEMPTENSNRNSRQRP
jgi:hypothetical protein